MTDKLQKEIDQITDQIESYKRAFNLKPLMFQAQPEISFEDIPSTVDIWDEVKKASQ